MKILNNFSVYHIFLMEKLCLKMKQSHKKMEEEEKKKTFTELN